MSEKEELEKGVAESKQRQIMQGLNDYLDGLVKSLDKELKFSMRTDHGFFLTVMATITIQMLMLLLKTPQEMMEINLGILQVLQILMIARSWFASRSWSNTHSEFVGALHTLELLGMIPPRDAMRRKQKRPLWEKGIELVQSWTKQSAKKGALAPA